MNEFLGFHENMTAEEYHGAPGLSASQLIWMGESMAYYKWRLSQKQEPTPAMLLGNATHLMLEARIKDKPELVKSGVVVFDGKGGTKSKAFDDFVKANPDKYAVVQEDFDLAQKMVDAVMGDPEVANYFTKGVAEASIITTYPGTEVMVKCRPDYLRLEDGLSINFKTARDASPQGFIRMIAEGGSDWQSAFYIDVLKAHFGRDFDEVHILAEKTEEGPIKIGVYTIDDESLAFARAQYRPLIEKLPECRRTDSWPQASRALQSIKVPFWAQKVVMP